MPPALPRLSLSRLGLGFVLLLSASLPASAQSTADRLERMERDLSNLQRYMYSAGGGGPAGGATGASTDYRERVEVRLNALESELRDMTGRFEETSNRVRRMQERLDKLVQDMDFRLTQMERAVQSGGAASPPGSQPTATVAGPSRPSEPPPANLAITSPRPRSDTPTVAEPPRSSPGPAVLPAGNEMEQYSFAQRLVAQTRYDEAEGALREFVRRNPNSALIDNARYWLGETYYVRKRYEDAAATFLEAYQGNPKGAKAPDSLLKLGLSLAALRKTPEACVALGKLTREHQSAESGIIRRAEQEKSSLNCS